MHDACPHGAVIPEVRALDSVLREKLPALDRDLLLKADICSMLDEHVTGGKRSKPRKPLGVRLLFKVQLDSLHRHGWRYQIDSMPVPINILESSSAKSE